MENQKLEEYYSEHSSTIFSEMLDEICNELECARYKAMYLAGAADYEKLSK